MRRGSSQQGADPSLRRGDLTLHKPHYQTGVAARQSLVASGLSRQLTATMPPLFGGHNSAQDAPAMLARRTRKFRAEIRAKM